MVSSDSPLPPTGPGMSRHADNPPAKGVCLHGGEQGLDTLPWDPIILSESTLFSEVDVPSSSSATAVYRHVSSAGTDGFPCGLEIEGFSSVSASSGESAGKVTVILRAKILEEGAEKGEAEKGTPVNLTVHWGFNLGDFAEETVKGHKMFVNVRKSCKTRLRRSLLTSGNVCSRTKRPCLTRRC